MDTFAHGLWSNIVFHRLSWRQRAWAIFFGMAPDIFSFGPHVAYLLATRAFRFHSDPPDYAVFLYKYAHSLIIFGTVLAVVALVRYWRGSASIFWLPLFGWAFHICIDILTHTKDFFPTPFLYPMFDVKLSGIDWTDSTFMVVNYTLILMAYIQLWWRMRSRCHKLSV